MTVTEQELEAVRQLYRRYTGSEISTEQVGDFGEYVIRLICAIHDM
jgi:hypothetical protein